MANKITRTTWKESKHYITGVFSFSDKSKTQFEIEKNSGVYKQWGNTTDNNMLCIPKLEQFVYHFCFSDL